MNELERWANFYLTMSAAAATLLGLMFVVITLAAERGEETPLRFPFTLHRPLSILLLYYSLPRF
jgi:hypothetical protein